MKQSALSIDVFWSFRSPYSYLDKAVQPTTTYFYKLGAVDTSGHEVLFDPTSVTTA